MTTQRKNIMLGTAGHVDHGKTALVKLLTGCNTDRLAEEQRRGLTIDLGFAPCRIWDERIVGVVDVPGHVDFIRNMVAGAHGIDVVIFVVAANDGVMPQTREHLDILTLLGVRHGLIAMTKMDLVDPEMLALAMDETRQFVRGTFLEEAPICPMSNITGEGFDAFYHALNEAVGRCEERQTSGIFRVWISDVFSIPGFGSVVTGVPSSGVLHVGDKLRLVPGDQEGRVRKLQVYGEETDAGRAGECVAFNLVDIPPALLKRGMLLSGSQALAPVTMAEAELRLLDSVAQPVKDMTEVHLHLGTAETMAQIAVLDEKALCPGRSHFVQLRLTKPLGMLPGDRFVIRAGIPGAFQGHVTTIGGGQILGVSNIKLRRNRSWTLEKMEARRNAIASPEQWCAVLLQEAYGPLTPAELAQHAMMTMEQTACIIKALQESGVVVTVGGCVVHREVVTNAARRLLETLEAHTAAHPTAIGLEEAQLPTLTGVHRAVASLAINQLIAGHQVERQGAVIAPAGRTVSISPDEQRCLERMESLFRQAGLMPSDPAELPALLRERPDRVTTIQGLLVERGVLVKIAPAMLIHQAAVEQGKQAALALFAKSRTFTTMEFRDALGVSRKYAVPLLDYLDTIRFTARNGNQRTPGVEARKLLNIG